MKIRNGFVSNSSSSSFLLIARKTTYDKVMENQHPYIKAVLNTVSKEDIILGQPVVIISTWSGPGGDCFEHIYEFEYSGERPESKWDDEMYESEAVDIVTEELKKDPETFIHSEDW